MRLNLLPTTVKKTTETRAAWFVMVLIAGLGIAGAVFLVINSSNSLKYAQDASHAQDDAYTQTADFQAKTAENVAKMAGLVRNINLYKDMDSHIDRYPELYNGIKPYIPNFFRLTEMNAQPAGQDSEVTLTGVVGTYQQYADLMLALLRIPKPYGQVESISRSGYQHTEAYVPALDDTDMTGRSRRPGTNPVPDDPLKRLEYLINQGSTATNTGYLALNNFGSGQPGARGPREGESLVTITFRIPYSLQTPDPRATLALAGGGGAAGGTGTAPGTPPPPGGGPPAGPGRTLPAPGGNGTPKGGKGADNGD